MPDSTQVAASEAIQRATGRTFHLATRFLPERVRHPTHVLYGFFRIADEVVDAPGDRTPAEQRAALADVRAAVLGDRDPDHPVLAAFREVRRTHGIPADEVEVFLDAMERDVTVGRYETYADLESYMRGSAVAVANMMCAVIDPADPEAAAPHAAALGEAFQLTNFLRDVREDVEDRDRVYLPLETLRAHGSSAADVASLSPTDGFRRAMRAELARTEERYREGVAGIQRLPRDCQFPVLLAAVLYADYHRLIRARACDVLTDPPELTRRRKLWLVARTYWHWRRTGDPEAAFYAASALSRSVTQDRHGLGGAEPAPQ